MAAQTPATWTERIPPYSGGNAVRGEQATLITTDALNTFRALVLGLAQQHGLPADASHEAIMAAVLERSALTGEIKTYAGAAAPAGWLSCNGALISRADYAALYEVIGITYGTGDGSTTFALPDLRGRIPIGAGHGAGLTNRGLGVVGGMNSTH